MIIPRYPHALEPSSTLTGACSSVGCSAYSTAATPVQVAISAVSGFRTILGALSYVIFLAKQLAT